MEAKFKIEAIIREGDNILLVMDKKEYLEFEDFKYNTNTYFYEYDIYQRISCYRLREIENFNGSNHLKTLILKPSDILHNIQDCNFFQINGCHLWIEYTTECFKNEIKDKSIKNVEKE